MNEHCDWFVNSTGYDHLEPKNKVILDIVATMRSACNAEQKGSKSPRAEAHAFCSDQNEQLKL